MASRYASNTRVSAERSMLEIQGMLVDHGCAQFQIDTAAPALAFAFGGVAFCIRLNCPLVTDDRFSPTPRQQKTRADLWRAERDRLWRVMVQQVRARLVGVDEGLFGMAEAFLPYALVHPNMTFAEAAVPALVDAAESGTVPALPLLGGPRG